MTTADASQLLYTHFPEFRDAKIELITDGWDNDVLVVDDEWIFRIPRDVDERPLLVTEARLLDILHNQYQIKNAPKYTYVEPTGILAGYKKLEGVNPTAERVTTWSDEDKSMFGMQLGVFLRTLHNVQTTLVIDLIRKFELLADVLELQQDVLVLETSFPSTEVFDQAVAVLDSTIALLRQSEIKVLVHRDMNPGNLLWDDVHKQLNIIDFSDRAIAHPGIDMAYLFEYDDVVLDGFCVAYGPAAQEYLVFAKLAYQCIGLRVFRAAMKESKNVTKEEGLAILTKKLSL